MCTPGDRLRPRQTHTLRAGGFAKHCENSSILPKLVVTSATLVVTGALLVVTRS